MVGRGLLGRWGPNQAADPIVTCRSPVTKLLYMVAIKRGDTGTWAIPGGMVDDGEMVSDPSIFKTTLDIDLCFLLLPQVSKTLMREFMEEAAGEDSGDSILPFPPFTHQRNPCPNLTWCVCLQSK